MKIMLGAALSFVLALPASTAILATESASATLSPATIFQAQPQGLSVVVIRDTRKERRRVARVEEPWLYCSPVNDTLYVVPAGYITDFASVPRFARFFFPEFGDWAEAAVIHDWLYDVGEKGGKAEADAIFRKAIEEQTNGPSLASRIMYLAVRAGGGRAYKAAEDHKADWAALFINREGAKSAPPFGQPNTAVWKRPFDCAKLDIPLEVEALRQEYPAWVSKQPPPRQPTPTE